MTPARTLAAVLAAPASLALVACSPSEPATASPSSTASPTTTAVATTTDPTQEATEQAQALVIAYFQTIDALYADPTQPIDDVYGVAVAPEATNEAAAIQSFRGQGYTQTGSSTVESTSVGAVDLTNDPAAATPVLPSVALTVCVDVSQVDAVDAGGISVVAPDRPGYLIAELTVVNVDYPNADSWRVREAPNRQASACDG